MITILLPNTASTSQNESPEKFYKVIALQNMSAMSRNAEFRKVLGQQTQGGSNL